MADVQTFRDLIQLWPTAEALSRDVKRHDTTKRKAPPVRDWMLKNRIPEPWFDAVLKAAQERGFEEVDYRLLSGLYRRSINP